jgi:ABC-2 type transport system ATP-binding protein
MSDYAVKIKELTKRYDKGPLALDGVDLEIKKGEFFALLGPNGAGKSTLINIISGVVKKTHGDVEIFGVNQEKDPTKIKFDIGVVPQEISFDPFLTVWQTLEFQSGYYGIKDNKKYIEEILVNLNLIDKKDAKTRSLSGGMKRRLLIGKALVHKPRLLILDEPTAGVDVELRHTLWKYVRQMNEDGLSILLTTHYLEEAEALCERIAIVDQGTIKAVGKTKSLMEEYSSKKTVSLNLKDKIKKTPKGLDSYQTEILEDGEVLEITLEPGNTEKVFKILGDSQLDILNFSVREQSLEDVFLKLTYEQHAK